MQATFEDARLLSDCNAHLDKMDSVTGELATLTSPHNFAPLTASCEEYRSQIGAVADEAKRQRSLLEYRMR